MAITILSGKRKDHGLRPLKPSRDLLGVANLIEEAFAGELDRAGRVALQEMRWMGRWSFLMLWFDFLSPDANTYLNGFVWVDHGKVVGNTTVSRSAFGSRHWFISNVAVSKTHRGRGYARQMMDAALEFVKEMNGYSISLQVRRGNTHAIKLYQSMGFKSVTSTSHFFLPQVDTVAPATPLPGGLTFREHNLTPQDSYAAFLLARETVPALVQREVPLHQSQYRLGTDVTFNNFWRSMAGQGQSKYWVLEEKPGKFVATLNVQAGLWNSDHKLSFMVHPDWWGKLEETLLNIGLEHLKTCPRKRIIVEHSEYHPDAISALLKAQFKERHTHILMKLTL